MNANTQRIKWEYFMMKNYVDGNPPKSWLDLFTIKQVKQSHGAGISAAAITADIWQDGRRWRLPVYSQKTPLGLSSGPRPLVIFIAVCTCVPRHGSLCRERLCQWGWEDWPHSDSSCFCLCHRRSVSLLSPPLRRVSLSSSGRLTNGDRWKQEESTS